MRRLCPHILLLILLPGLPAAAQAWLEGDRTGTLRGWMVDAEASYHAGTGAAYPGAGVGIGYARGAFRSSIHALFNEELNFTFAPGDLIVYVDDPTIEVREEARLSARPDRYALGVPLEGDVAIRLRGIELGAHFALMLQQTRLEQPEALRTADDLYVITWNGETQRQARLLGGASAKMHLRMATIRAGVLGLPIARSGDEALRHGFTPAITPFAALDLRTGAGMIGAGTTSHAASIRYAYRSAGPHVYPGIDGAITYHTAVDGFDFHAVDLRVEFPLGASVRGRLGVSHGWSSRFPLERADFAAWQQTLVPGLRDQFGLTLPHTALRAGVQMALGRHHRVSPLTIASVDLNTHAVFPVRKSEYEVTPIGSVVLSNTSARRVAARLVVGTSESGGRYESDAFVVEPESDRRIPIFLKPGDPERVHHERLRITVTSPDGAAAETSVPITTFTRNAWDGNTAALRYFLTPDEPAVRRNARDQLVGAQNDVGPEADRLALIRTFLERLGRGLRFVEDPTTTLDVDHVQYPIETLRERRGDCEVLTVFLASSLMAVGISAAVVDLRPHEGASITGSRADRRPPIGHLFLLVDTGIRPAQLAALGLNEFQAVTRTNASGEATIWIPVETTVLASGIETAFREGVRQYAQAAFGGNIHADAAVRVVDL